MAIQEVQRILSRMERTDLVEAAWHIATFRFPKGLEYAAAANISGIRGKSLSFSRRLDSRTLFASDSSYGNTKDGGTWTGPEKPLLAACRRVMKAAGIPRGEIASLRVLSEFGASAERLELDRYRKVEEKLLRKE